MSRNMYQQAVDSQTACNLSGLMYSLPKIADQVWEEIRARKSSTTKFNEHPVIRLFAEQIAWLGTHGDYSKAAQECEEKAKEPAPAPMVTEPVNTPDGWWKVEGCHDVQRYEPLPHPLEDSDGGDIRRVNR